MVFRDVTEQRQAHMAQARLAAIVEVSGDAVITKNLQGIIQTWKIGAERLFGYKPEERLCLKSPDSLLDTVSTTSR